MDDIDMTARKADRAVDGLAENARDAIGRAADRANDAYGAVREAAQAVDPFVKDRPYVSLGLAVLAGLIVGGLFLPRARVVYVKPAG